MEKNWPSDVEFIGLDDEYFNLPYTVTILKNIDLLDLPVYSFKHDVINGMHLYSKFSLLFDGLVKDADDDLLKEFENKCGELAILYTLAKAVIDHKISKKYIDPQFLQMFFKGKYTLRKIQKYFELVGRVTVRIFDQSGRLLVKVDSIVPSDQNIYIYAVDDGTGDKVFKRAHATLCAVVSDTSGRPHIHIALDTNAKKSIMGTDNLNIFNPI